MKDCFRIKTFNDAVAFLTEKGLDTTDYFGVYDLIVQSKYPPKDIMAFLRLRIIAAALNNESGLVDSCNLYYPNFEIIIKQQTSNLIKQLDVLFGHYTTCKYQNKDLYFVYKGVGCTPYPPLRQLALKSADIAEYCGIQFMDYWADLTLC